MPNKKTLESELNSDIPCIKLLNICIHPLTVPQLHSYIGHAVTGGQKKLVLNTNVHCYNLAYKHSWLQHFLNSADITFCDGAGVVLGAKILGYTIPGRITYADWIWKLAAFASENDFSFFFLGAKPGVAEKAAQKLIDHFPNLKITTHHGYFDMSQEAKKNLEVIEHINTIKPNILILGLGMPLQERWLKENWTKLEVNIGLTGGAVFDYVSGELRRGPRWMTDNGMEWLARLLIEPKRLWKRYLIGNLFFFYLIFKERLNKKKY
ncbi:MAG: glycosyltransferase, partial [Candidatus Electrothrix sp. AUS3]|nr:glycosyltransferase [Candidatus Electrothrix gigas]